MKRDCSVLPSIERIESIENIESKRIYVAVFLLLTIILVSACADAARETNNPDIGSPNPPTFKTAAGDDTSDPVEIIENTQVSTDVTLLAEDPDGNLINWKISTAPVKGTAVISADSSPGTSKTISYIPQAGATGADSFVVTIDDGTGFTSSITVNVTIAFTVSVTVSGYTTGNTMVLQINGKNDLLVSVDGTFTFSDTLDSGDRYEVTNSPFSSILKTSCLFNNASGEIISSNITNVAVICADDIAPNIVSITPDAGTTGVALDSSISVVFDEDLLANSIGTDAVLLSDTLGSVAGTINYNVSNRTLSIVPIEPLALFRPYTVTLSPEITDIAGQAVVSNPWTFKTRDGVWSEAVTVEVGFQGKVVYPQLVLNSAGQGIVAWSQIDGSRTSIWAKRFDSLTNTWDEAEQIEVDDQQDAVGPLIALDSMGQGFVVWGKYSSSNRDSVWARSFNLTEKSWGKVELIDNKVLGDARVSQITMNSSGRGIVLYRQDDGTQNSIWVNRFDVASKKWVGPELVTNDSQLSTYGSVQITLDSLGRGFVVWKQDGNISPTNVWTKRFGSVKDEWSIAERLDNDNHRGADLPQIASNSAGQSIVVWRQYEGVQPNIWAKHFNSVKNLWDPAKQIENGSYRGSSTLKLTMNSGGQSIAMWRGIDDSNLYRMWAIYFDPEAMAWGNAELIGNESSSPQIAMNASGLGIATWEHYDGVTVNVWANRFDPGSKIWGDAELVESNTYNTYAPQVALDGAGHGVVVWGQTPGLRIGVNRFE